MLSRILEFLNDQQKKQGNQTVQEPDKVQGVERMQMSEMYEQRVKENTEFGTEPYIRIPIVASDFTENALRYQAIQDVLREKRGMYCYMTCIRTPYEKLIAYKLTYCAEEGDHGDEDGYGVEPDIWVVNYYTPDEKPMGRFMLETDPECERMVQCIEKEYNDSFPGDVIFRWGTKYAQRIGKYTSLIEKEKGCIITGYKGKIQNGTIVLPRTIEGYPVVRIFTKAFYHNMEVEVISLPEGILRIDYDAFKGCTNLKEITVPSTIQDIGHCAFAECEKAVIRIKLLKQEMNLTGYPWGVREKQIVFERSEQK